VSVVEVSLVGRGAVADQVSASAVVESELTANLVPEATGIINEILADEGDPVVEGQVLATLENVALGTGAARARAEVARLADQASRTRALFEQGAISARELGEAEHALNTARLSLREASAGYGNTRILAPFDGVVALRNVKVGELATSATMAFQIVDLDALRVVASFPERELGRVRPGQPVRLASAYDTEQAATGIVQRVSPVVDSNTGTFRVTVSVDPGQTVLRPGQFVTVTVEVGRHQGVPVVPKKALVYEDGVPVVYRVVDAPEPEADAEDAEADEASDGEGGSWWPFGGQEEVVDDEEVEDDEPKGPKLVAERRVVTLGLVDDDWAEVEEGVDPDDTVVTVGQSHLRDGARVRPQETADDVEEVGAVDEKDEGGPG
jgi:membrane fusion protein (multidrug efflux system)